MRIKWLVMVFLGLLAFIAYANSLGNAFVSDDIDGILNNQDIGNLSRVFSQPWFFLRPLFYFGIVKMFGLAPLPFRLLNISFHLGTVLVAYLLLCYLLDRKTAFFASALFAVHPLEIEAVGWISGGTYSQYGFFILLALFLYILSLKEAKSLLPAFVAFALGLYSTEKAVIFPLIIALFIISFQDTPRNWKTMIPFFIAGIIWGAIQAAAVKQRMVVLETNFYQQPQILNPLIQIPIAVTSYLELIFWPAKLTLYHSELSFSLLAYCTRLLIFIIFIGIIAYAWKRDRQVFFWLSFFIIILLPTLTPLGISSIVAERYAYLAGLGVFVVIAILFRKLEEFKKLRLLVIILFSLIIFLLLLKTWSRNTDWKDEDSLWLATAQTSPSSPNTHNNLGDVYGRRGDLQKAAEEFARAIRINPRYADAYHNLANIYLKMGRLQEAGRNYEMAISLNPMLWQSYQNLAAVYFALKEYSLSRDSLIRAIQINPRNPVLRLNLGTLYIKLGEKGRAREEFLKALQLDAGNAQAQRALRDLD